MGSATVIVERGEHEEKVRTPACNTALTENFLFRLDCTTNSILLLLSYSPSVHLGKPWRALYGWATLYRKGGSVIFIPRATNREKK